MKKIAIATLLLLSLTACGERQTAEELKQDAEFAKTCRDSGGKVGYNGWANDNIYCTFEDES